MPRAGTLSVPFSAGSADAVAAYEAALDRFLACSGDPLAVLEPALAAEPGFAAGHLLVAGLAVAAWDKRSFPLLRRSLAAMLPLAASANGRERAHFAAARCLACRGAPQGGRAVRGDRARVAGRHARAAPHAGGLRLRRALRRASRRSSRRSLAAWRPEMPGYEHVLAMHAYALAESGDGARAEESGRRAAMLRPHHPFAIHAVAHALLDQGRAAEGAKWLAESAADRASMGGLARHLAWHDALFQLELGRIDRALAIFDASSRKSTAARLGLRRRRRRGVPLAARARGRRRRRPLASDRGPLGRAGGRRLLAAARRARGDGARGGGRDAEAASSSG